MMNFLSLVGLVVGFIALASNPSPYYAALGLVLGVVCGCWVLMGFGISFLSLVLLLIYLGGMLVVFAYSAFLAAEPYPEAWGNWSVLAYIFMYILGVVVCYVLVCFSGDSLGWELGFDMVICDCSGVGWMYISGVVILVISGWGLFLALFVVLGVTWGVFRGSLRAV